MDHSKLTRNIVIGMFAGIVFGSLIYAFDVSEDGIFWGLIVDGLLDTIGKIFIISLKLLVVPLVFVSLACGASSLGSGGGMGRVGLKTLGLYLFTTAVAITLALSVATVVDPGAGMDRTTDSVFIAKETPSLKDTVINIFPSNPLKAMAEGNMLQVIVFAILVGVAISKCGEVGERVRETLNDWNEIIMMMVMMLMSVAPYGVFCLLISLFARMGFSAISELIVYFLVVAGVLLLHFLVSYGLIVRFIANINPVTFYKRMAPVMAYGFSTSSSNATLPITLETVEHKLGVKKEIASFTVPLGATINMDGTAIMQGVATVFIASAYNIDMSFTDYLLVILTATLASIGTAGVPGVGLIMLALVLDQVGLPVEGIGLIIGVDRLLDMMRTSVNVTGDAAVSAVVARSENKFDMAVFEDDRIQDPVVQKSS